MPGVLDYVYPPQLLGNFGRCRVLKTELLVHAQPSDPLKPNSFCPRVVLLIWVRHVFVQGENNTLSIQFSRVPVCSGKRKTNFRRISVGLLPSAEGEHGSVHHLGEPQRDIPEHKCCLFGHGSKSRFPRTSQSPLKSRRKWVVHRPQNGIPLALTHSHVFCGLLAPSAKRSGLQHDTIGVVLLQFVGEIAWRMAQQSTCGMPER